MADRNKMVFGGMEYTLNQCSDLFKWFEDSKAGEFTYYYSNVVFHHPSGRFYGAYTNDLDNYIQI